ncbi:MAG TPA: GNAT family N-acetyltransferase [Verrucomicrobiae bacterium]|nr:GNAT family N-acetyltransferase [Verrucomicrobiae bacterium]
MEIRAFRECDAQAWWDFRLESLTAEPSAFGKSVEEHWAIPVETMAGRFRDAPATNLYLGAFEDSRLAGMATLIREESEKMRHKGHIYGVYVAPEYRGRGIGRALIGRLVELASEDPTLEQILLAVATTQHAAKQMYQSFGFETYGTEPKAMKIGSDYVDEDLMILRLRKD